MKMPLFTAREKCSRLRALLVAFSLLGVSGLTAQPYGQPPPAGYIEDPNYAFQPASNYTAAGNGAYSPGDYQPPTVTPRGTTKTKFKKTAASAPQARASSTTSGRTSVEAKVGQLAQNDERQDQRLYHLERDVSKLKAGSGSSYIPTSIRQSGHYISKPSSAAPANTSKLHTVREGETLWRIAAKYNTSVNAIRAVNRIPGDTVAVGQTLAIPGDSSADAPTAAPSSRFSSSASVHIVKKGQTFDEIARSYKVSSDALARANPSAYPDKLLIGEKLNIPGRKAPASASVSAFKPGTSGTAKSGTHIVRPGQSLGAIAKSYGISTARLVAANKLKNPNLVEIGHVLVIPGGTATGNSNGAAPSRMTTRSTAPQVATHTRDTVPLPGAGMPLSKPAPVEPPVKPTPPAGFAPAFPASPSAPAPAPARKANLPVGSHRGVVAYRLERGDDIDSVANMFSTTSDKIRELNKLGPDAKMKEGDELIVPAMGPVSVD